MTEQEAREEIPTFDDLRKVFCARCMANDWYCPSDCEVLEKTKLLDFKKIIQCYARNDGDLQKVKRYIQHARMA